MNPPITDDEIVAAFRAETRVWQRWMAEGRDDDNACADRDAALADAISDEEMERHLMDVLVNPELWQSSEEREDAA
jgi:hypothetical protein